LIIKHLRKSGIKHKFSLAWSYTAVIATTMPIIPATLEAKAENHELEANLGAKLPRPVSKTNTIKGLGMWPKWWGTCLAYARPQVHVLRTY
jgi:hypothetical protein